MTTAFDEANRFVATGNSASKNGDADMAASVLYTTSEIHVTVTASDYSYQGTLAGIAIKRSGKIRYIVEDDNGRLFIHNAMQLGKAEGWMPN